MVRPEVLEELRLLTNYNMDAENRLCLLLLGQSELRRRLSMAVHEALSQRIVVRYHLSPLTREELPAYLTHRLRCAGTELPIFEPPAQEALFQASGGLPRKVNRVRLFWNGGFGMSHSGKGSSHLTRLRWRPLTGTTLPSA